MKKRVAILIGSLRKESWNRKTAEEVIRLSPASLDMQIVELGELSMYNEDLDNEKDIPAAWVQFRQTMQNFDAVLFVTPEYNRSIPAVLKNAIDLGSRPYGKSVWVNKCGAVISTTPGGYGAFGANHVLRQSMVFLDVPMLQQPEMYLSHINTCFDEKGHLDERTTQMFTHFLDAFEKWVLKF